MKRKILSILLSVAMVIVMMPSMAFATVDTTDCTGECTHVAAIIADSGIRHYDSLEAAVNAVSTDGVEISITLLTNTSGDVTIASGQNITLDINGKTLDGTISVYGSLTIQDSLGQGVIKSVNRKTGGNIAIEGGTFVSCPSSLYWPDGYIFVKNESGTYSLFRIGDNSCYLKGTGTAAIGAFPTVAAAIDKISGTGTHYIILCKDMTEDISIPEGKKINLDLSGYTLTGSITNSGTLTVKDSKATSGNPNEIAMISIADKSAKLIVSDKSTCSVNSIVSALPEFYISGSGTSSKPYTLAKYIVSIMADGITSYKKTLPEAIETASTKKGAVVTIFGNITTLTNGLTIPNGSDIILDLNGYYIKVDNITGKNIQVDEGAKLTIKDSTDVNKDGTGNGYVKYNGYGLDGMIHVNGTFIMESGRIFCNVNPYRPGVAVWGNGIVQIHGGKIDAGSYALAGNGNETGTTTISIDGGILSSKADVAIYHPQNGTLTISGGTITGQEGVQMCSGKLTIEGNPSIIATGTDNLATKEGDGSLPDGAAVSIINRNYPGGEPSVNISGTPALKAEAGEQAFRAYTWDADNKTAEAWDNGKKNIFITGGIYSDKSVEDYLNANCEVVSNTDSTTNATYPWIVAYKLADYTAVNTAISNIPADLSLYKEESVAILNAATNAVVRDKNITEQAMVDAYATAIQNAISALEYKDADYSKVDEAIAKVNALNKNDYKDFTAVEAAIRAVVRDKNITEQDAVDAMAKAIEDAINALEKKPVTAPITPSDSVTNSGTTGSDNAQTNADMSDKVTVSEGTASTVVDQTTADKIVDKAVANESKEVVIDATTSSSTTSNTVSSAQVGIPTATLEAIAEKTDADVTVKTDVAEVKMDNITAAAVAEQATGDTVQIIAEKVKEDQQEIQFELKVVCSNGTVISDFKGGNVSVTVPVAKDMADKNLVCVYIDDNGIYHKVDGAMNEAGTHYTFTTGHFSTYAIMSEEEADAVIAKQTAAAQKAAIKNVKTTVTLSTKEVKKGIRVTVKVPEDQKADKTGIIIYRSTSKNAKPYAVYKKVATKGSTYIIRNYYNVKGNRLVKGKTYYYKARAYKVIDGKTYYGPMSTIKAIKAK